jgi:iron complex outermembrane receptor protein
MDNIQIGYTIPHFSAFKSVRIFGTVQNVFTITGYSGIDPEAYTVGFTSTYGIDRTIFPRSRTYLLGAGFNF